MEDNFSPVSWLRTRQKDLRKPFVEVEHDDADVFDALAGDGKFGHDAVQFSYAFGVAEFVFDRDTVTFI